MDKREHLEHFERIYLEAARRVFTDVFVENHLRAHPEDFLNHLRDRLILPEPAKGGISPAAQITIVTAIPRTRLDVIEGERIE